ncbi:MAG: ketoacyl-ACP synthase III [Flavobacteriaceae bacterium]|jgi:3-oxoacyl-[acyl-carrier-protein] synthase-3|nr:ketoacyl-ACP synthase III [Flavobacteriaceae bacterium]
MQITQTYFYHPSNFQTNESIIKSFEQKDIPMQKIQNSLGREKRFILDANSSETTLTMAIDAAKGALEESNLSINDIDIIALVSSTPELLVPSGAIKIHKALNAKEEMLCFDMNANCIGAFIALDQLSKYLNATPFIKRALIICAENLSRIEDVNNPVTAFCFSDSAFAFIVEKDDTDSGLKDVMYHTDSGVADTLVFPPIGFSNFKTCDSLFWDSSFDGIGSVEFIKKKLEVFLERNNMSLDDISLFLFSQFSFKNVKLIKEYFNLEDDKVPFYSHELGYTGSSSPFLALDQYQRRVRKIKKGEHILFWTLGAGYEAGLMLWKY